jgi:hypothetical protein
LGKPIKKGSESGEVIPIFLQFSRQTPETKERTRELLEKIEVEYEIPDLSKKNNVQEIRNAVKDLI